MKQTAIKILLLTAIAAVIAGCGGNVMPEQSKESAEKLAASTVINKSWVYLPIPMYINENVPEKFRQAIIDSMEKWNAVAETELFAYAGDATAEDNIEDGANVISWNNDSHPDGYFGTTTVRWINNNVIVESDIVFYGNPDSFAVLECEDGKETCVSDAYKKDVTTTALHELGHVLGFIHTSASNHIMNPHFTVGDVHHQFDNVLTAELMNIYGPELLAVNE